MDAAEFWSIVESTRHEEREEQLARLDRAIEQLEDEDAFRACFAGLMRYACDWRLWDASRVAFRGMRDETFYGVRAWLVSRGRERYFEVLENPDSLVEGVGTFEAFGRRIAGSTDGLEGAFTGQPLDDDDREAFWVAFPKLSARYDSIGSDLTARARRLYTHRERLAQRRRSWILLALTLALSISAWLALSWYWAVLATIGLPTLLVAGAVWFGRRQTVGAFISRGRSLGNASRLVGNVDVAVVCIRPPGETADAWDDGEVTAALELLQEEAQRHGVELSFRRVEPTKTVVELPRLLGRFGRYDDDSIAALERYIEPLTPRGNGFVLVLSAETACTPSAWSTCRIRGGDPEFSVCPRNASASIIAHEVLHLFGGQDLYVPSRPGALTHERIIDDVATFVESVTGEDITKTSLMTNLSEPDLTVDPVTAAAVGWTRHVAGRWVPIFEETA